MRDPYGCEPEETTSFLSPENSKYGSIHYYPESGSHHRHRHEDKTRCRLISILFGSLGLLAVVVLVISNRGHDPSMPVIALKEEEPTKTVTKPWKAEPPSDKGKDYYYNDKSAKTTDAPAVKTTAKHAEKPTKKPDYTKYTTAKPKPEYNKYNKYNTAKPEQATTETPKTERKTTEEPTTTEPTTRRPFYEIDAPTKVVDKIAEKAKSYATRKYASTIKRAQKSADAVMSVASSAAQTLETSALAAEQKALDQTKILASEREAGEEAFADKVEVEAEKAAQLYKAYVKAALAAGDKLQSILQDTGEQTANDVIAASEKLDKDWAEYQMKQQLAREALQKFKDQISSESSDVEDVLKTPSFMSMQDIYLLQTSTAADAGHGYDWRKFVPGYGTPNAPAWMKYLDPPYTDLMAASSAEMLSWSDKAKEVAHILQEAANKVKEEEKADQKELSAEFKEQYKKDKKAFVTEANKEAREAMDSLLGGADHKALTMLALEDQGKEGMMKYSDGSNVPGIPKQWIRCGTDINCCLQVMCGSIIASAMSSNNPTVYLGVSDTLSCTSTNPLDAASCFGKPNADPATKDLEQCLQCNSCIPISAGAEVDCSGQTDTVDIMHYGR